MLEKIRDEASTFTSGSDATDGTFPHFALIFTLFVLGALSWLRARHQASLSQQRADTERRRLYGALAGALAAASVFGLLALVDIGKPGRKQLEQSLAGGRTAVPVSDPVQSPGDDHGASWQERLGLSEETQSSLRIVSLVLKVAGAVALIVLYETMSFGEVTVAPQSSA